MSDDTPLQLQSMASLQDQAWQVLADFIYGLTDLIAEGAAGIRAGLRQLPMAEAIMRRLIYLLVIELEVAPPAPRPASTPPPPGAGQSTGAAAVPARAKFRLLDPALRDPHAAPYLPEHLCPRISLMDATARPAPLPPEAAPASGQTARKPAIARLALRLAALTDAYMNMEDHARRMAQWMARQRETGAARTLPLNLHLPSDVFTSDGNPLADCLYTFHCHVMALAVPDTG